MKTNEIRERYLEFFRQQGHTVCESDVLVPRWDPTVLFTPAGMNPFKDHFLGKVKLDFTRATSCQKCLRTGDIENVGRTAYHHTFFEMLGNFSFGDYFKREAIHWAWEFLTSREWLGIDADRLTVSVYLDDDEAATIWHEEIGLATDRIARLGEHDNFWPAGAPTDGPDGVCGPCSEIFFHPDNGPECEIWNLVFTQFNRSGDPPDNLQPLPRQNIDTGMGLERIAAVLQGKTTNYHIDSLLPLVESAAQVCRREYVAESDDGRRCRRIADHVRACAMAIHENVYPDKNKENYTVRRLLRRAVLQGHEMGMREPFLYQLVPTVVELMASPYPELRTTMENVADVIRIEEAGFLETLDTGMERVERVFSELQLSGQSLIDGKQAFDLYQEQGIPAELFESMGLERGLQFDWTGYHRAVEQHALDSGAGEVGVMGDFGPVDTLKRNVPSTDFIGYECTRDQASIQGCVDNDAIVDSLSAGNDGQMIVLDRTPFYAAAGGQVADTGWIVGPQGRFEVRQVEKSGDLFIHTGSVTEGSLAVGNAVAVEVDEPRRKGIERAHTATHILHYALQKHLGEHAQQRGSKVEADQLRFDFANREAVSSESLAAIEQEALARIASNAPVRADILPMADARKQGAMMLFGEKYPDPVRMVSIGDFSKELCGGTHVKATGDIGEFEILSEEASSAGTRRIVALTGAKAKETADQIRQTVTQLQSLLGDGDLVDAVRQLADRVKGLRKALSSGKPAPSGEAPQSAAANSNTLESYMAQRECVKSIARGLNVGVGDVTSRIEAMISEATELEKQIAEADAVPTVSADELLAGAVQVDGVTLVVREIQGGNPNQLRELCDQIRRKQPTAAVFLAAIQGPDKVLLVAGVGTDAVSRGIRAGDWVKQVAPVVGGGGGGKPDFAQAGGKQPDKLNVALDAARQFVQSVVAV